MRTAIFLGLLYVRDSIRDSFHGTAVSDKAASVFGTVIIIVMVMDFIEFANNLFKK